MDFSKTAPETLALVKNAEAIAINQVCAINYTCVA